MSNNNYKDRIVDVASHQMLDKAAAENIETCFNRAEQQKNHCGFGKLGTCCRICHMGPCRITPKAPKGICGADADTIVARNLLREVAAGVSNHSDHGRHLVLLLKKVAKGEDTGYAIKDVDRLLEVCGLYGIETEDREVNDMALELANLFINEFSNQEGYMKTLNLAPLKRQAIWEAKGIKPHGIDRSVVEAMHRTAIGVDHDWYHVQMHSFRTALSNGWGGSRIASMVSDILFGTPNPLTSEANLGVLRKECVNIILHGHDPTSSEAIALATKDPEIQAAAKAAGAEDIQLSGLCCTANEVLMRHGVPLAGNMLQQELAIVTGAVEVMCFDVQCNMPGLIDVAKNYHTKIISTDDIAKTVGATHISSHGKNALEWGKEIVRIAIDNFKNRDASKVNIPQEKKPLVAGFSVSAIKHMLGGKYRATFRPLNDAIISGRILGVVGMAGCNSTKTVSDHYHITVTKELLKRNILCVQTGCAAITSGKAGMLTPEAAFELAGEGLQEICETVGIPPILHLGACIDNTRILEACCEIVAEGGLGDDIGTLPALGIAPEWMSEKAIGIGHYLVASGVDVILGNPLFVDGSENEKNYLYGGATEDFGACFHYIADPVEAAEKAYNLIMAAREKLGINKKAERKLFDMADRRAL